MKPFNPDAFQKKIDEPFRVKPEVYFELDTIAVKMLNDDLFSETNDSFLHDLFIEIQTVANNGIVAQIIELRDNGHITNREMYVVGNCFMVGEQIGPDMADLKREFLNQNLIPDDFNELIATISIPESIKQIIYKCYKKMKGVG